MRLASLYSGGKDSTFAMYIVEQMGYEISYLVNIVSDCGDSYIFHTPNLNVVPLMAKSMNKKLVTKISTGTEESDMNKLKSALIDLDIDGIVTGSISSDYQWDRINIICDDLGLAVVAPLWRKDEDLIMDELLLSGIRAIIVGCYAEGMGENWLGREIDKNAVVELKYLHKKYGISITGEGGEYESMTIDSPMHSHPINILSSMKKWSKNSGTMNITSANIFDRM